MCSTVEERLALIGKAIDEVAAAARTPDAALDDLAALAAVRKRRMATLGLA